VDNGCSYVDKSTILHVKRLHMKIVIFQKAIKFPYYIP